METELYTAIAEKLRDIGNIDEIGVVSGNGRTAVIYAGNKTLKNYFGGRKKLSVIFQITGMDLNENQKALIDRLCETGKKLTSSVPEIPMISQPKIKVNSLPAPVTHNETSWIYAMTVEIIFYTGGIENET